MSETQRGFLGAALLLAALIAGCYMAGAFAHAAWVIFEFGWNVL